MAVSELRADESREGPGDEVLIARQPVIDRELRATGFRVAYADGGAAEPRDAGLLAGAHVDGKLLIDVLSAVGLGDFVASGPVHVNVSAGLLSTIGVPPISSDGAVLRVAYSTASDPEMRDVLRSLARAGYKLSLRDVAAPDFDASLLEMFDIVEVDFAVWDELDAAQAAARIIAAHATPLADGLTHYSDFELARALGFELFFGPFFTAPRVGAGWHAPVGDLGALAAVAALPGDGTIEQLEQVIDKDLGLSLRLLRYINAAYFGMRGEISSIRQAVMMLGARGVSRWALLVALTGGKTASRELCVIALTRARMCEELAATDPEADTGQLFTVGLLSLADALLELPLTEILAELPLSDEINQALLWRSGLPGEVLDAAIAFEQGRFDAYCLEPYRRTIPRIYRDALRWAQETLLTAA